MATISIKGPFKGINRAVSPELVSPEWAVEAQNCILSRGDIRSENPYKFLNDIQERANTAFGAVPTRVINIHSVDNQFGLIGYVLAITNDGFYLFNPSGGQIKNIINSAHDVTNIEIASETNVFKWVNFKEFVFGFNKTKTIVLYEDPINGLRFASLTFPLILDPVTNYGVADTGAISIAVNNQQTNNSVDVMGVEYTIEYITKVGSIAAQVVTNKVFASTNNMIREVVLQWKIKKVLFFANDDDTIGQGQEDMKKLLRIYKRVLWGSTNTEGGTVDEAIATQIIFFDPGTLFTGIVDNGDGTLSISWRDQQWEISGLTPSSPGNKPDTRDATSTPSIFALPEGADDAVTHTDNRLYLAKQNKIVHTFPSLLDLEDEFIVDRENEDITALNSYFNNLIIQKANALYAMSGFPPNQLITRIADSEGGLVRMFENNGILYLVDKDRVKTFNGAQTQDTSKMVQSLIRTNFDTGLDRFSYQFTIAESELDDYIIISPILNKNPLIFTDGEVKGWTENTLRGQFYNAPGLAGVLDRRELLRVDGTKFYTPVLPEEITIGVDDIEPLGFWVTPLLSMGDLTHDKHWLNLEVDHNASQFDLTVTYLDKNKVQILVQSLVDMTLQSYLRLAARSRYLQLAFTFIGSISEIRIQGNPLAARGD